MTSKIAYFDLDESLASYMSALRRDLEKICAPGEDYFDPSIRSESFPEHLRERIRLIRNQRGWWTNLDPILPALDLLDRLRRSGYEIHILTKGPWDHPEAWSEKLHWCNQHIGPGKFEMHVTSTKAVFRGDVLYDDDVKQMSAWLEANPDGRGIMPLRTWNRPFQHPRIMHWEEPDSPNGLLRFLGLK